MYCSCSLVGSPSVAGGVTRNKGLPCVCRVYLCACTEIMVARQLRGVELRDPLGNQKTVANKLWIPQSARFEWGDHSTEIATEIVRLQVLGSGQARDVFRVVGQNMVLKLQLASYHADSNGAEAELARSTFNVFMPAFYGEALCDWGPKGVCCAV